MNKLDLLKKVVSTTAGLGVGQIVGSIIAITTPQENTYQKVTVRTAAFVLGMAAGDKIGQYTDQKIDDAAAWWKENIQTKV